MEMRPVRTVIEHGGCNESHEHACTRNAAPDSQEIHRRRPGRRLPHLQRPGGQRVFALVSPGDQRRGESALRGALCGTIRPPAGLRLRHLPESRGTRDRLHQGGHGRLPRLRLRPEAGVLAPRHRHGSRQGGRCAGEGRRVALHHSHARQEQPPQWRRDAKRRHDVPVFLRRGLAAKEPAGYLPDVPVEPGRERRAGLPGVLGRVSRAFRGDGPRRLLPA